ncbi:hypothetical protein, partial [Actinotalea ferrariae]|uniref:hypothetical protein n=1 Tax=Actinotalea ferrariae TaxID=1386098 RepID=UPI0005517C70
RRRVVELFGWDCVARDTEAAYRTLLESRGRLDDRRRAGTAAGLARAGRRPDRRHDDMAGVRAV